MEEVKGEKRRDCVFLIWIPIGEERVIEGKELEE